MRKTARKLRAYNPVQSHFGGVSNNPIKGLVEDIMEKGSKLKQVLINIDLLSIRNRQKKHHLQGIGPFSDSTIFYRKVMEMSKESLGKNNGFGISDGESGSLLL